MIIYVNECVSCERCMNCGRDHMAVRVCDWCGNGVDESVPHRFDGGDLCEECYAKAMSDEEEEEE
jgi:rRNA maturation protein Nop10